jgi:hypothetical protein
MPKRDAGYNLLFTEDEKRAAEGAARFRKESLAAFIRKAVKKEIDAARDEWRVDQREKRRQDPFLAPVNGSNNLSPADSVASTDDRVLNRQPDVIPDIPAAVIEAIPAPPIAPPAPTRASSRAEETLEPANSALRPPIASQQRSRGTDETIVSRELPETSQDLVEVTSELPRIEADAEPMVP